MDNRTCLHCEADLSHRRSNAKYCSNKCSRLFTQANETRLCTLPECDSKRWARDLCLKHYTYRYHPNRHRKVEVGCSVCGKRILRRVDNSRMGKHCCSIECRRFRQFGEGQAGDTYDWNQDAKQRARDYGASVVEDVDRLAVMERDGWSCYQCGKDTSLETNPFSPDAATVDHVIPLSHGGQHSMGNVRCCCLACNCSKADRERAGKQTA